MIAKIAAFLKDVRGELAQVSWPTRRELIDSTKVVLVTVAGVAVVIGFFDLICARLVSWIIHG